MVGKVVKSKVSDMEEDLREVFSRKLNKDMTCVVQEVVGKKRYLVRLKGGG